MLALVFETDGGLGVALASLWQQAVDIWIAGGWAMIPIALVAMLVFGIGMNVWLRLREKRFTAVPEKTWRLWVKYPEHREGRIGELIAEATAAKTLEDSQAVFRGLHAIEIAPFVRDLKVMRVCIAAAPLFGLFGTVTGMLATFGALSIGSGGEKTMAAIAKGISEALITTETGLVVALPGLFFQYQLGRTRDRYAAFLAHLETVCTQFLYRRLRDERAA